VYTVANAINSNSLSDSDEQKGIELIFVDDYSISERERRGLRRQSRNNNDSSSDRSNWLGRWFNNSAKSNKQSSTSSQNHVEGQVESTQIKNNDPIKTTPNTKGLSWASRLKNNIGGWFGLKPRAHKKDDKFNETYIYISKTDPVNPSTNNSSEKNDILLATNEAPTNNPNVNNSTTKQTDTDHKTDTNHDSDETIKNNIPTAKGNSIVTASTDSDKNNSSEKIIHSSIETPEEVNNTSKLHRFFNKFKKNGKRNNKKETPDNNKSTKIVYNNDDLKSDTSEKSALSLTGGPEKVNTTSKSDGFKESDKQNNQKQTTDNNKSTEIVYNNDNLETPHNKKNSITSSTENPEKVKTTSKLRNFFNKFKKNNKHNDQIQTADNNESTEIVSSNDQSETKPYKNNSMSSTEEPEKTNTSSKLGENDKQNNQKQTLDNNKSTEIVYGNDNSEATVNKNHSVASSTKNPKKVKTTSRMFNFFNKFKKKGENKDKKQTADNNKSTEIAYNNESNNTSHSNSAQSNTNNVAKSTKKGFTNPFRKIRFGNMFNRMDKKAVGNKNSTWKPWGFDWKFRKKIAPTAATSTQALSSYETLNQPLESSTSNKGKKAARINFTPREFSIGSVVHNETYAEAFNIKQKYKLNDYSTGLLMPLLDGDFLETESNQIHINLLAKKKGSKGIDLKLGKFSNLYIDSVYNINYAILRKGRVRVRVGEGINFFISTRDNRVHLDEGDDVVIDLTGNMLTKIITIAGEVQVFDDTQYSDLTLEEGTILKVGMGKTNEVSNDAHIEILKEKFNFVDFQNLNERHIIAREFSKSDITWPYTSKQPLGKSCEHCHYVFKNNDLDRQWCPHCYKKIPNPEEEI